MLYTRDVFNSAILLNRNYDLLFQVKKFLSFDVNFFDFKMIFLDLETNFAEIENDLITLSIMLKSPHSVDITVRIESWMKSLNELGMALGLGLLLKCI